jgi:acyl dehydratase
MIATGRAELMVDPIMNVWDAAAVQPVVDWLGGDSGKVLDYQVRFTRPVLVDAEAGADVTVVAKVGVIDDDGARIDLTVTFNGETVLGKAQVRVALA